MSLRSVLRGEAPTNVWHMTQNESMISGFVRLGERRKFEPDAIRQLTEMQELSFGCFYCQVTPSRAFATTVFVIHAVGERFREGRDFSRAVLRIPLFFAP